MPRLVRLIVNGLLVAAAGAGLVACSSPSTSGPPAPSLRTARQSEKFFASLGGGPFSIGRYTGGLGGSASGGANGSPCIVLMGGSVTSLDRILLYCLSDRGTFQQARTVMEDTVRHFVPDVSMWAARKLAEISDPSQPFSASSAFDGKSVQVVSSGGTDPTYNLTIEPTQLAASPTTKPASLSTGSSKVRGARSIRIERFHDLCRKPSSGLIATPPNPWPAASSRCRWRRAA